MPLRLALPALATLLAVAGCSTTGARDDVVDATTGNMAAVSTVPAPTRVRWFTGQLVVEPVSRGRACLVLSTSSGDYALRSADPHLSAVAWQEDGAFDAVHSGIARDGRLVAPYSDDRTSVRGAAADSPDGTCGAHRTLAFVRVSRNRLVTPDALSPTTPDPPAADGPAPVLVDPLGAPVEKSGTITAVRGNQGEGWCLALETAAGLYTLSEDTRAYDAIVTTVQGRIDQRRTGFHVHGRSSLAMARSYGQQVDLVGTLSTDTDVQCSRYYDLRVTGLQ